MEANCDGEGTVDIADLTALIDYLFITFTPPAPCQNPGGGPTGELIDYTGCKEFETGRVTAYTPPDQDCIEWGYDGESILSLKHVNAGFNCCPEITADIDIENNIITIEEIELEGICYCLCLFDIDYEIRNLPAGEYRIVVVEPYLPEGDEPLDFTIDISSAPSGSHCVDRSVYPWGY